MTGVALPDIESGAHIVCRAEQGADGRGINVLLPQSMAGDDDVGT
jgi:hypothetical protein